MEVSGQPIGGDIDLPRLFIRVSQNPDPRVKIEAAGVPSFAQDKVPEDIGFIRAQPRFVGGVGELR